MTDYLVDSGNWKVKVAINDIDCPSPYMEAATQAVEAVFGMRELNPTCELISLMSEDGVDYFSEDFADADYPRPMFSIVTLVCKLKDVKHGKRYVPLLTSKVFENAGQPINVELARKAELLEPDKVRQFIELQQLLEKKKKKKG